MILYQPFQLPHSDFQSPEPWSQLLHWSGSQFDEGLRGERYDVVHPYPEEEEESFRRQRRRHDGRSKLKSTADSDVFAGDKKVPISSKALLKNHNEVLKQHNDIDEWFSTIHVIMDMGTLIPFDEWMMMRLLKKYHEVCETNEYSTLSAGRKENMS